MDTSAVAIPKAGDIVLTVVETKSINVEDMDINEDVIEEETEEDIIRSSALATNKQMMCRSRQRFFCQAITLTMLLLSLVFSPKMTRIFVTEGNLIWNFDPTDNILTIRTTACDVHIQPALEPFHNSQISIVGNLGLLQIQNRKSSDALNKNESFNYLLHRDNVINLPKPINNGSITSYLSAQNPYGCDLAYTLGRWGCVDVCNITISIDPSRPPPSLYIWQFTDDLTPNVFLKAANVTLKTLIVESTTTETHLTNVITTELTNVTSVSGSIKLLNHQSNNIYLRSTKSSIYVLETENFQSVQHNNSSSSGIGSSGSIISKAKQLDIKYRSTNELGCFRVLGVDPKDTAVFNQVLNDDFDFRKGMCPLFGEDTGASRSLLNVFNPTKSSFLPRAEMSEGYIKLNKCIGPYCPRFSKPDYMTDLIYPTEINQGTSVFQPSFSLSQKDFVQRINNLNDSTLIPGCERPLQINLKNYNKGKMNTKNKNVNRKLRMITDEGEVRVVVIGNSQNVNNLQHENRSKNEKWSSTQSFQDKLKLDGVRLLKKDIDKITSKIKNKYGAMSAKSDVYATIDIVPSPGIPPIRWIYTTRRLYLLIRPEFASFITCGLLVPKEILHFRVHLINGRCEDISNGENPDERDLPMSEIHPELNPSLVTAELLEEIYSRLWQLIVPWPQKVIRGDLVAAFWNVTDLEGSFVGFSPFANGHRATLFASSTSALVFDLAIVSTVAAFVAGLIAMQVMLRLCSKLIMKHSTKKEVKKRLGTLERNVQKKKCNKNENESYTFEDILKKEGTFQIYLILDIKSDSYGNVKVIRTIEKKHKKCNEKTYTSKLLATIWYIFNCCTDENDVELISETYTFEGVQSENEKFDRKTKQIHIDKDDDTFQAPMEKNNCFSFCCCNKKNAALKIISTRSLNEFAVQDEEIRLQRLDGVIEQVVTTILYVIEQRNKKTFTTKCTKYCCENLNDETKDETTCTVYTLFGLIGMLIIVILGQWFHYFVHLLDVRVYHWKVTLFIAGIILFLLVVIVCIQRHSVYEIWIWFKKVSQVDVMTQLVLSLSLILNKPLKDLRFDPLICFLQDEVDIDKEFIEHQTDQGFCIYRNKELQLDVSAIRELAKYYNEVLVGSTVTETWKDSTTMEVSEKCIEGSTVTEIVNIREDSIPNALLNEPKPGLATLIHQYTEEEKKSVQVTLILDAVSKKAIEKKSVALYCGLVSTDGDEFGSTDKDKPRREQQVWNNGTDKVWCNDDKNSQDCCALKFDLPTIPGRYELKLWEDKCNPCKPGYSSPLCKNENGDHSSIKFVVADAASVNRSQSKEQEDLKSLPKLDFVKEIVSKTTANTTEETKYDGTTYEFETTPPSIEIWLWRLEWTNKKRPKKRKNPKKTFSVKFNDFLDRFQKYCWDKNFNSRRYNRDKIEVALEKKYGLEVINAKPRKIIAGYKWKTEEEISNDLSNQSSDGVAADLPSAIFETKQQNKKEDDMQHIVKLFLQKNCTESSNHNISLNSSNEEKKKKGKKNHWKFLRNKISAIAKFNHLSVSVEEKMNDEKNKPITGIINMKEMEKYLKELKIKITQVDDTLIIGAKMKQVSVHTPTNYQCCYGGEVNDTPSLTSSSCLSCKRRCCWYSCEGIEVMILSLILIGPCVMLFVFLINIQFKWAYLTGKTDAFAWRHFDDRIDTVFDFWSVVNDHEYKTKEYFLGAQAVLVFIVLNVVYITFGFCERFTERRKMYNENNARLQLKRKKTCCQKYFCGKILLVVQTLMYIFDALLQTFNFFYSIVLWIVVLCMIASVFIVAQWSLVMSLLNPVNFLPLAVFFVTCFAILVWTWVGLKQMVLKTRIKIKNSFQNSINGSLDTYIANLARRQLQFSNEKTSKLSTETTSKLVDPDEIQQPKFSDESQLNAEATDIFDALLVSQPNKTSLDFEDFRNLLNALNLVNDRPNLQFRMFAQCDTDGNGEIDRHEFAKGWDGLMDELVEQVGNELGITETNMYGIAFLFLVYFGLLFAFLVLFIGIYDDTSEFSSIITSFFVVMSGYSTKFFTSFSRGDYADKNKIDRTVANVFGKKTNSNGDPSAVVKVAK